MKHIRALAVLAVVLAVAAFAAAYANSLDNAFHFDDSHVIEQNLFIRDLANVPRFFTDANTFSSLPANAVYRPITALTFALDYSIAGGLATRTYHVTQLLLFALLGSGLWVFYRRLFDQAGAAPWNMWTALFAALLFCVHTANSQVGNYISARSELLAALGVVGGFLVYQLAPAWRRWHLYLLPVAVGALAKNHAVVFAPLLLCYKFFVEEGRSLDSLLTRRGWQGLWPILRASLPAFVLAIGLVAFIEGMHPPGQSYGGGNRIQYLLTSAWVWVRYVALYFVPLGLSADTDLQLFARGLDPRSLAGFALLLATIAVMWRASRAQGWSVVAFGLAWFWIGIAPTSSVVPLAEVTNDHRPFLGFIGLNAAVVFAMSTVLCSVALRRPKATWPRLLIAGVGTTVLGAHIVGTVLRNRVWATDETLWADTVEKSPRNARALMNYGLSQMSRGRYPDAQQLFLRAKQITPNYSYLETNLGIVTAELGDTLQADAHFRRAIALESEQPGVHFFYGRYLVGAGRGPDAITALRRSVALGGGRLDSRHLLMATLQARGQTNEVAALARATLSLVSSDAVSRVYASGGTPLVPVTDDYAGWFALGWSFTQQNRHVEAAQAYRVATLRDASQAVALSNLGWTLGRLGFFSEAIAPLERAVALDRGNELARNNLAWVRGRVASAAR